MCGLRKVKMTSVSCRIFLWSIMDQESPGQDLWKLNSFHIAVSKAAKCYFWPNLKNLPAVQETGVWSLGWEDSLQKVMATHSSALAWRIPWMVEPSRVQSMGSQRVRHDWVTNTLICRYSHKGSIWNLGHLIFFNICYLFWLHQVWDLFVCLFVCFFSCSLWDLAPWPGIEPRSPALGAWNLSCWTTR